ncbi:hypothetical protein SERLADRAFT_373548 [Serpula lacrymans var. lacrymans S7.9]|uniref:DDE-1 domain-containing protein n=1 Tax=Serpula lacrymans var. lacrymans (strain S7.9) TaxID=578457 RepID=F8P8Y0_SERL9|nr:uncharacterized protein SERLADRAFT_373548 [Serpula lacrymans var. lacrymans S7.9]EGO20109.1 hypothetical protein SERLADRAFT_373548 [Serpula lacrymans var. lacrymans S7.9]
MANPMCPKKLRSCVRDISGKIPGKHWHYRFISRNPSLVLRKPQKLDPKRAKNFNRTVVADYFAQRKQLNDMYGGIPPEHDWNMDEKGIQMGGGRKGDGTKYFYNRKQKGSYRISDDNLELVTVIECISAAGVLMKPGFVLKEGPLPDLSDVEGIGSISRTKTGWTNRGICEEWFNKTFIPESRACRIDDRPVVLTLDGHDSHEQPVLQALAYEHSIIIYCLPSKTTHKLQPLDVVVFAPVGRSWSSHASRLAIEGIKIDRYNIVPEYLSIRHIITPELIRTAFKETGIYPFNPNVFTEGDFAPSQVTSTSAHFPDSYPSDVDTSDESFHTSDGLLGLTTLPGPTVELDGYHDQEPSQEYRENNDEQEDSSSSSSPTREGSTLPPELFSWPRFSNTPPPSPLQMSLPPLPPADPFVNSASRSQTGSAPSPSPSQLGLDVFPSPTPSDRVRTKATFAQRRCSGYMTRSSSAQSLKVTLAQLKAERDAANAHCTLARRDAEDIRKRSGNHRKPRRGTTKPTAQFLTHPELKAVFEQQEIERKEKARIDTEKEASKQQEDTARNTRITIETVMKVFDRSFASYKRKEDLIVIAGALGLPIDGTVKALIERIKSHLQGHKELADNPQFAGLFGRRIQAPEGSSHSGQSSQSPLYSSVNSSTAFSPHTPGPSYNFNISERVLPPPTDENGVTITYYNELGQPYYVL